MGLFGEVFRKKQDSALENAGLTALFDEFYDRLVYFSFQMLHDKDQAKDIAQDAFISYWQQRHQVDSHPAAVKKFLYTSVKNATLNVIRHLKVVNAYAGSQGDTEPEEKSVMDAIITSEVLAAIQEALWSLPETYRIISIRSYLEGKKNQEIADELGISVNTVKKQKQRALELLRLKLTPELFAWLLIFINPGGSM